MAITEITVSIKDTEAFAELLKASFDFLAWYNRTYQQRPSNHPDHPYCKIEQVLHELLDGVRVEE